jgi:Lon protease-like protein
MEEIGLFPLQIVLLPTERVPLHVFEERYKELIGECLAGDSEFGLVYADDEGVRDIGTRGRVAQVVTRFPDGRLNVLVDGGERFRLQELTSGRSFHTGVVSALEDDDDPAGAEAVERALGSFARLREVTGSDVDAPAAGGAQLSFELASRVDLPAGEKLALLSEVSERRRMELVAEFFEAALARAERARTASERASTNGRVELG